MGKVYVNQTKLTIKLDTGVDCSSATETLMGYRKPDGTTGYWTSTVDTDDTTLVYAIQSTDDIDTSGTWTFWTKVTFSDTNVAYGEPAQEIIYSEGE